ncbi:hypothetical protein Mgra_00002488 [Meloidogyne graminicola]|uniref:Uncharacterized protein n=1 Tax=Meloidogyne graminicola TaxID=189291 RepID=A0A8S9ZXZ6_9BILA|nr:hypothetical protein Mgra_00002488 [Meloidogyne graminicola]
MFKIFYFQLFLFLFFKKVNGFCMKTICSSDADSRHPVNRIIKCSSDGICGNYKSLRRNDQFVEAVDLSCREGNFIYSPFEGKLSSWRPFNGNGLNEIERHEIKRNNNNNKCLPDRGVRIDGVGQWQENPFYFISYHVLIGSVRLFRYSGHVLAGQKIGIALDIECEIKLIKSPIRSRKEENFIRIYLHKEGRPIDPTHHLIDCMCLNQICETNRINSLEGSPFKFDSRFNGVRGWEIKCPDIVQQNEENSFSEEEEEENNNKEDNLNEQWGIPRIYSPIEGELVGRIRINSEPGAQAYSGCTNEGIFIVGAGKWNDYEVRIYNARFLESLPLGRQNIEQGQHIGYRLVCPNDQITPTVFIEVRFQGVLIDISDAISAKNCKHKSLRNLIF